MQKQRVLLQVNLGLSVCLSEVATAAATGTVQERNQEQRKEVVYIGEEVWEIPNLWIWD